MNFAYIRISTNDGSQKIDRQWDALLPLVKDERNIYIDKMSGKDMNRPQLQGLLKILRRGDRLYIESISRLARNTSDFLKIVEELKSKEVELISLKENIDTSSPYGKFIYTVFASLYELEKEFTADRRREGQASAKARGVHMGRAKATKPRNWNKYFKIYMDGEITSTEFMRLVDLKKTTFYKFLNEEKALSR